MTSVMSPFLMRCAVPIVSNPCDRNLTRRHASAFATAGSKCFAGTLSIGHVDTKPPLPNECRERRSIVDRIIPFDRDRSEDQSVSSSFLPFKDQSTFGNFFKAS